MSPTLRPLSLRLLAALACLVLAVPLALADEPLDPPGRVARISLALGSVSLQPAGSDQWVADVLNRPLTNDDRLWSDRESRAELHVGSTAIRLGAETGVGILNIDDRTVQVRLSSGTLQVRVRSLAPDETLEIATPAASIAVLRPGSYRIDVNDSGDQLHVAVRQGQVAVTDANGAQTVDAGQLADFYGSVDQMQVGSLPAGDAFDQWASDRDRREDRAVSTRYVSRDTIGYEDLDDYGTWRTVDDYGPVWVPSVAAGWTPYRDGHWAWVAPWGWTWIDDAPWGFAPAHYGRWINLRGQWCWAPGPRTARPLYAPALVGWVGGGGVSIGIGIGGPPVGWFPLGWNEVYVPSYRHSAAYVQNINVTNIHVTNTFVTNAMERGRDDRREPMHYANMGVAGALVATSRSAFAGSQRVGEHLAQLPPGAVARLRPETGAPGIAPSRESLGRPAAVEPRREIWTRPVVARMPPPPPAQPFEAQRRAVIANGGRPVAVERAPGSAQPGVVARPDAVRVIRGGGNAPAYAPPPGAPVAPVAPATRADRPPPSYRPAPPSEWRRDTPASPRSSDTPRPNYDRPVTPAPAPSPAPAPEPRRYEPRPTPPPAYEPPPRAPTPAPEPRRYEPRPTPPPAYEPPPRAPTPAPAPAPEPRRYEQRPTPPPAPAPAPANRAAPAPAEKAHPEKPRPPEPHDR